MGDEWVRRDPWPGPDARIRFPRYATDGSFLHRTAAGSLLMVWTSVGNMG